MTNIGKSSRIRYDEGCLAAHALNLIGDRWALLVVRELMFAAKRFQMIRAGMPGVTASVLTARLAQLREAGVVIHDPRMGAYALTDAGRALLPVLESLCRWALIMPGHDPKRFISPSALMISMGVCLMRDRIGMGEAQGGFDFDSETFTMHLRAGMLETRAADCAAMPFVLRGDGNTLAAAVYGTAPLPMLVEHGFISVTGDAAAAQDFVDMFRLSPQP